MKSKKAIDEDLVVKQQENTRNIKTYLIYVIYINIIIFLLSIRYDALGLSEDELNLILIIPSLSQLVLLVLCGNYTIIDFKNKVPFNLYHIGTVILLLLNFMIIIALTI